MFCWFINGRLGDDDEYVPPKPEVVEVKEDDAFYTVKLVLHAGNLSAISTLQSSQYLIL